MKKLIITLYALVAFTVFAQEGRLPQVELKDLNGKNFSTQQIENGGKPIYISFWATWCSPCKKELNAIHENYDDWKEQTGVKVIAVSIDDSRNMAKVAPYVNGRGWDFEVYLDANQDFKRAMNVNNVPHSFLLNGNGEIVWQHNAYAEGDETKIFDLIKKVAATGNVK
jgi:thiol-disulfide isomerase/thioredoxin